ncbi:MAG: hypothetical protein WCO06_05490, partial [Candidatus Roizmanbacteria bacterium]
EKTDLYATGMMWYAILTGKDPSTTMPIPLINNRAMLESASDANETQLIADLNAKSIDDNTINIIRRCITFNEASRFSSAKVMLDEIRNNTPFAPNSQLDNSYQQIKFTGNQSNAIRIYTQMLIGTVTDDPMTTIDMMKRLKKLETDFPGQGTDRVLSYLIEYALSATIKNPNKPFNIEAIDYAIKSLFEKPDIDGIGKMLSSNPLSEFLKKYPNNIGSLFKIAKRYMDDSRLKAILQLNQTTPSDVFFPSLCHISNYCYNSSTPATLPIPQDQVNMLLDLWSSRVISCIEYQSYRDQLRYMTNIITTYVNQQKVQGTTSEVSRIIIYLRSLKMQLLQNVYPYSDPRKSISRSYNTELQLIIDRLS